MFADDTKMYRRVSGPGHLGEGVVGACAPRVTKGAPKMKGGKRKRKKEREKKKEKKKEKEKRGKKKKKGEKERQITPLPRSRGVVASDKK